MRLAVLLCIYIYIYPLMSSSLCKLGINGTFLPKYTGKSLPTGNITYET